MCRTVFTVHRIENRLSKLKCYIVSLFALGNVIMFANFTLHFALSRTADITFYSRGFRDFRQSKQLRTKSSHLI